MSDSSCCDFFREAASRSRSISSLDILTAGLFFSSSLILSKISLSLVSRSSGVFGCSSGLGGSQTNCSRKSVRVKVFIFFLASASAMAPPPNRPIPPI